MQKHLVKVAKSAKKKYPKLNVESFDIFLESLNKVANIKDLSIKSNLSGNTSTDFSKDNKISEILLLLNKNKIKLLFMTRVVQTKMRYLTTSLIDCLNNDNYLVFALCSRSLFEHAGLINQLQTKIAPQIAVLKNLNNYEKVCSLLNENNEKLDAFFYSSRLFNIIENKRPINVMDWVDDLATNIPNARERYSFLCEFVHPNYGSNLFVYQGTYGEGTIDPPMEDSIEFFEQIIEICLEIITLIHKSFYEIMRLLIIIDDYAGKAVEARSKISYIFSQTKYRVTGSGLNKNDPLYFSNARTYYEHLEMQYTYIQDSNLEVLNIQIMSDLDNRFIYYLYETKNGKIWFKVPR